MSLGHGSSIVRSGLVLHLDAANRKSYSGSGTTWSDLSGSGNNGTLVNGVTYNTSNNGYFIFDGVNDLYQIDNFPFSFTSNSFTISFWFRLITTNTNVGIFRIASGSPFNTGGIGTAARIRTDRFEFTCADGIGSGIRLQGPFNISLNSWYNYVFTFDRANLTASIFRNSVFELSQSYAGEISTATTYDLQIGRDGDGFSNTNVSNFTVYNRVLSTPEIQQNFNALRGRYGV